MAAPRKRKLKVKPQRKRFIETAKQLGYDKTGESFERAFEKLVPPARKKPKPKRAKRK